ncbi:hypothetical protein UY3_10392 [Chelonia mydas]|uniref:Lamina-associated polypeptide 2 alpha C-terminal domain-containing protein n=1 Tax=Chelonia mydas TaxID=8469 RepID=M7B3L4_CHEMY|nr:hypothetical protein UY3_10392 [Chelonia mydas]
MPPQEAMVSPPPSTTDELTHFQDLFKRVANELKITLEEVPGTHHELTNLLQATTSSKIALLINGAFMEPAKIIWQTPATITPTSKRLDRKYFVLLTSSEFLFTHPSPNSLVVEAANQKNKHQYFQFTPSDNDNKRLDSFGRKVYSSSKLQYRVANYMALLAKYDHKNYAEVMQFIDDVSEDKRQQFKAVVSEGQLISRTALQAALDAVDAATRSTAMAIIMRHAWWFASSSFLKKIQSTVKDLPFSGDRFFTSTTNEVLHSMKDSLATLRSLGIQPPAQKRGSTDISHTNGRATMLLHQINISDNMICSNNNAINPEPKDIALHKRRRPTFLSQINLKSWLRV